MDIEQDYPLSPTRELRQTFAFAALLALSVGVFYTGLMYLVLWSSPWWTQGADWLVGR